MQSETVADLKDEIALFDLKQKNKDWQDTVMQNRYKSKANLYKRKI